MVAATTGVGAVGLAHLAVPFVSSLQPSKKAQAQAGPVRVDLNKLEAGAMIRVEWRGQPVYVARRTPESLKSLSALDKDCKDPNSQNKAQQPSYADNAYRSITPEFIVLSGVCTHLGCITDYYPEITPQVFDSQWQGGWYCPCHGSRFDMAGRVLSGSPASDNLLVPPHTYEEGNILVIGLDKENV